MEIPFFGSGSHLDLDFGSEVVQQFVLNDDAWDGSTDIHAWRSNKWYRKTLWRKRLLKFGHRKQLYYLLLLEAT